MDRRSSLVAIGTAIAVATACASTRVRLAASSIGTSRRALAVDHLLLAGVLAAAAIARLFVGPHVRDDAYITLRYAQHLATGQGFTFNSGERMLGTTTPLWTIVLAGLARLGVDPALGAVALGIAADLAVVYYLWRLGWATLGPRAALFTCAAYALATPTIAHAVSGMETSLYLLLILAAFDLSRERRAIASAAVCGLLGLIRPDGLIVPAVLVAWNGWIALRRPARPGWSGGTAELWRRGRTLIRDGWVPALTFGLVLAPWCVVAWRYFGSPIPHSLAAKWDLGVGGPLTSVRCLATYFLDLGDRWFLPTTLVAVGGAWLLWRGGLLGLKVPFQPSGSALGPLFSWGAAYTLAFLLANKLVYPLWPFEWYFLPILLPYFLAFGRGLDWLLDRLPRIASVALLVLCLSLGVWKVGRARATLDTIVGGRETLYAELANRLAEVGVRNDEVAAPEIGAFGYVYPGPLLDLHGLITPAAVGRSFGQTLEARTPPWLVSYETILPESLRESAWFTAHYRPLMTLHNWESRPLTLYRWYPDPAANRVNGTTVGADSTGRLELLGRRVTRESVGDADYLRIALTWRAASPTSQPLVVSVRTLDAAGAKLAQQDNEPQSSSRPTTTWRAGELVLDRYDLQLGPDVAERARWLAIAVYPSGAAGPALAWRSVGGVALGDQLRAPLPSRVPETSWQPVASFVGSVDLVEARVVGEGGEKSLQLVWRAGASVDAEYTVFVHLLDAEGRLVGQADGLPSNGRLPTTTWEAGDRVVDSHSLPGGSEGATRAVVGLYRASDGGRLARADAPGDSVVVQLAN